MLVEGVRAVTEALDAGVGGRFAVTSERLGQTSGGSALAARLASTDLELNPIDDAALRALASTEHPQGVLLVCSEPRASLDLVEAGMRLLVLDGVQDPGNSGTLVRAAVAFGLDAVIVLEGTADPWGAKTVRASAGMAFRIPVIQARSGDTVAALRHAGVPLLVAAAVGAPVGAAPVGTAPVGAAPVGAAPVGELGRKSVGGDVSEGDFALAVGNEGAGVRDELRDAATSTVSIPMPGPAESLNVAMAGSVLLYELAKESGA